MGKLQKDVRVDQVLKEAIIMPAQTDLAGSATLTEVVTAHNALLQKLRDAGLMEE
ncbi:hypothetical protein [Virgibacillus halodenitrificans]|uniref:Uncharacterized protein n=1 Tax=Virgibacillus halodenitrificans TaxID=1482 RepID=A0ABR7VNH5_VIRHA|nr:hypothetical protein [Virgibacillus halodenitrificans]MBD1223286.1 hypothetical protein [Virgibacillus halodenitrificans]